MKNVDILRSVRNLLSSGHAKHAYLDIIGSESKECRFCMVGAIMETVGTPRGVDGWPYKSFAVDSLQLESLSNDSSILLRFKRSVDVYRFNDDSSDEEVLEYIDDLIEQEVTAPRPDIFAGVAVHA